jgi:AraC family transcriptional regulator of arabinose operon
MTSRIEEIIGELNAAYQSGINVDKLARSVGLSPSRLQHLFKSETGMSIGQYVKRLRLQKARAFGDHTSARPRSLSCRRL